MIELSVIISSMNSSIISGFRKKIIDSTYRMKDIPEGTDFEVWRVKILNSKEFGNLTSKEKLLYFCIFGILAPTSHNSSPERFKINPDAMEIEISLDKSYILTHSDRFGRQACISIGCVIGNIKAAAESLGFTSHISFFPVSKENLQSLKGKDSKNLSLVKIRLVKSKNILKSNWLKAMRERKVVRAEYDESLKIKESLVNKLIKKIDNYSSLKLYIITDKEKLHLAGKLQEDADRSVFENTNFSYELGKWILPNKGGTSGLGMRGREFGFSEKFAEQIHKGLLKKGRLPADQMANFARGGRVGIESSSGIGIICTTKDDVKDWILCGMALEESALILQTEKLNTSIHAGIAESDWVNSIFASTLLHTSKRPATLFRIGIPKRNVDLQRPHSSRPLLDKLVIS